MSFGLKRQAIEKDRVSTFSKDIVTKNPIFSLEEIKGFFEIFNLYADERRQASVNDMVHTAKILGLDKKNPLIYEAFCQIGSQNQGSWIRFQQFLTNLTNKLVIRYMIQGNVNSEDGRRAMFELADLEGKEKLTVGDLLRLSDNLGLSFSPEQIQTIVKSVAGPRERELTWAQFNEHIAKKVEKNSVF